MSKLRYSVTSLPVIDRPELKVDPKAHAVTWQGQGISLTLSELVILHALASHPGMVRTRGDLLDALGDEGHLYDRTVNSHVKRLRRALGQTLKGSKRIYWPIETVYGVGWRWLEGSNVDPHRVLKGEREPKTWEQEREQLLAVIGKQAVTIKSLEDTLAEYWKTSKKK